MYPTRPRVDALLQIGQGRGLLLLDLVQRKRNPSQHSVHAAGSGAFGNACSPRRQFA
jgi:hypothetical protein